MRAPMLLLTVCRVMDDSFVAVSLPLYERARVHAVRCSTYVYVYVLSCSMYVSVYVYHAQVLSLLEKWLVMAPTLRF